MKSVKPFSRESSFNSALGRLGGYPFAPDASGNIATEDTLHLFDRLGVDTGINLGALLEVPRHLAEWLPGQKLEGHLLGAGPANR